jgi:hypothetical protein
MGTWGRAWTLQEVQKFIGHSSVETTQRYAHLSPEHLHSAAAQTLPIVISAPSPTSEAPTQDVAATTQPIENTPQLSTVGPGEAHVGPDLGPSEFGPPANCAESEENSERATGFEPATASLGIHQRIQSFRQALAAASHSRPTGEVAREFLIAVGQGTDAADGLLNELVLSAFSQAIRADQRLALALQVTEGGPFRWRRGIELAAQLLTSESITAKGKEGAR